MGLNLNRMIDQVAKEKGITRDTLVEALEAALVSAARKKYGGKVELEAQYSDETGEVEVFLFKDVVDLVEDATTQIDLETARRELDPEAEIGDQLGVKMEDGELRTHRSANCQASHHSEGQGRRARKYLCRVQGPQRGTWSPVWSSASRSATSSSTSDAQKRFYPSPSKSLGKITVKMTVIRALILDVRRTQKDPQIILSRSNAAFLVKLFEQEVPEIAEGIVRIMCAAREPGQRAKIGVRSTDADVDPVGACVGMKGSRVQAVVQELRGEKIDIIPWNGRPCALCLQRSGSLRRFRRSSSIRIPGPWK